jgi:GNAT superfamily N-acetyltransferase
MTIDVRTLNHDDLDGAARLLARRHQADRSRTPALSSKFDLADAVRPALANVLTRPTMRGVVAVENGEPAGFLAGAIALPAPTAWYAGYIPTRSAQIDYTGHAAPGDESIDIYRRLYAELAPYFLEHGCFVHYVEVNAGDDAALEAWYSLGFGQASTLAFRDTSSLQFDGVALRADVEVHQAAPEDIEVAVKLNDDLLRHHNASPMFVPYLPESFAAARAYQSELLAAPAGAHWLAYQDGQPVAMQTFDEQNFAEMARPENGIYLFQGITAPDARGGGVGSAVLHRAIEWARDAGYACITLHYLSPNVSGARFWQRSGFRPLTHTLVRRIDDRIAWAYPDTKSLKPSP